MFDIGWSEMLVIAVVAIIVIGPKELPGLLRTLGRFMRKAQNMASEFRSHVDDMVRESDLHEMKAQVERLQHVNLEAEVKKTVDPAGDLEKAFDMSDVESKPASILPPSSGTGSEADPTAGSSPSASTPPQTAAAEPDPTKKLP